MRRNTAIVIGLGGIMALIVGLDFLAAEFPAIAEGALDHAGQLVIVLVSIATAATVMRDRGERFFDDDEDKRP